MFCRCALLALITSLAIAADPPPWVAEIRDAVVVELAADALPLTTAQPAVDVETTYDPVMGIMQGRLRIALDNDSSVPWNDIGFVLYANNQLSYKGTAIAITAARVDGQPVVAKTVDDGRGVLLPLAQPLAPGAWATCELEFSTTIPDQGGRAGLLTRSKYGHTLYSWLPEPAVYRDGWQFPALVPYSDPSFVRAGDYCWRLTMPAGWTLVASGKETQTAEGTWSVVAPRTRNLVAWISDQPVEIMRLTPAQGPEIRVAFVGKHTIRAAFCASVARDTIAIASKHFGAYPRRSYDVVFTRFSLPVGGMEASGMTFLHQPLFAKLNWRAADPLTDGENDLLHATVHEVMHSWWYDQVGNDTHAEPWLDEPLTEWSSWFVMEKLRSKDVMQKLIGTRLPAVIAIANEPAPLNSFGDQMSEMQFGVLLYCRGPIMYEVLRQTAGEDAFLAALRTWYKDNAGKVVTRADWDRMFLPLLPAEKQHAFVTSWITGVDDPVPTDVDQVLTSGAAPQIRRLVQEQRDQAKEPADKEEPSAPKESPPAVEIPEPEAAEPAVKPVP